ncbi:hypothetical protein MMA231_02480 [Asticcacaulis sp. MM231]|uniref:hypothetical protein n=1 Tax=Asticcacaulis sp. MM231 TaxID=3157666 RepID=UPI0032D56D95
MTLLEKAAGGTIALLLTVCAWLAHDGQVTGLKADIELINAKATASVANASASVLELRLADASRASAIEAQLVSQGRNIRSLTDAITTEARADVGLQKPVDPDLKRALIADYQRLLDLQASAAGSGGGAADRAAGIAPAVRDDQSITD